MRAGSRGRPCDPEGVGSGDVCLGCVRLPPHPSAVTTAGGWGGRASARAGCVRLPAAIPVNVDHRCRLCRCRTPPTPPPNAKGPSTTTTRCAAGVTPLLPTAATVVTPAAAAAAPAPVAAAAPAAACAVATYFFLVLLLLPQPTLFFCRARLVRSEAAVATRRRWVSSAGGHRSPPPFTPTTTPEAPRPHPRPSCHRRCLPTCPLSLRRCGSGRLCGGRGLGGGDAPSPPPQRPSTDSGGATGRARGRPSRRLGWKGRTAARGGGASRGDPGRRPVLRARADAARRPRAGPTAGRPARG